MRTIYPLVPYKATAEELSGILREIVRLREVEDVPDFTRLNQIFLGGRSTERVPSSPTDVLDNDEIGDTVFAANGAYMYVLVNASGTPKWGRINVDTAW